MMEEDFKRGEKVLVDTKDRGILEGFFIEYEHRKGFRGYPYRVAIVKVEEDQLTINEWLVKSKEKKNAKIGKEEGQQAIRQSPKSRGGRTRKTV